MSLLKLKKAQRAREVDSPVAVEGTGRCGSEGGYLERVGAGGTILCPECHADYADLHTC